MLTEQQIDRFIDITSAHVGLDPEDVIATRDTLDSFIAAQGKPWDVEEMEFRQTLFCDASDWAENWNCDSPCEGHPIWNLERLYIWHFKHQRRWYVVDFGDVRAACLID